MQGLIIIVRMTYNRLCRWPRFNMMLQECWIIHSLLNHLDKKSAKRACNVRKSNDNVRTRLKNHQFDCSLMLLQVISNKTKSQCYYLLYRMGSLSVPQGDTTRYRSYKRFQHFPISIDKSWRNVRSMNSTGVKQNFI